MFTFKKPKYEVKMFHEHESVYKDKIIKFQKAGWEIAGQMSIQIGHNGYDRYILIPLKRKLK